MDAYQRRMQVANHEAGHAVSMFLYGRAIREIDVDRPERWLEGWVVPEPPPPIRMPPDGHDVFDWVDAHLDRSRRETAVIARVGSLVTGETWHGRACSVDLAIVLAARPDWLSTGGWEMLVLAHAHELLRDPRFDPAHRALSRALLTRPHETMPGERAAEIIEDALPEVVIA